MKPQELKDGRRYRLAKDIANPNLDKREKYAPGRIPWKEGATFRCSRWAGSVEADEKTLLSPTQLVMLKARRDRIDLEMLSNAGASERGPIGGVPNMHPGFELLVEALEELPESARDVIERVARYNCDSEVLQKLVDVGRISIADVEAAAKMIHEENNEYVQQDIKRHERRLAEAKNVQAAVEAFEKT